MEEPQFPTSNDPMNPNPKFSPHDWNFDTVRDDELLACCYWECARESAFIRDVKTRCAGQKWRKMTNFQPVSPPSRTAQDLADQSRAHQIGENPRGI